MNITTNSNSSIVNFSYNEMKELMTDASKTMVPFKSFFINPTMNTKRDYPRQRHPKNTQWFGRGWGSHGGGRQKIDVPEDSAAGHLIQKLSDSNHIHIPLKDLAILAKVSLVEKTLSLINAKPFSYFTILNQNCNPLPKNLNEYMQYPMLIILAKGNFPIKINWTVIQAIFTAELTVALRREKLAFEVVGREGFGSLFPTLSCLDPGLRLDPGLLDADRGAICIFNTLLRIENFFKNTTLISRFKALTNVKQLADKLSKSNLDNLTMSLLAIYRRGEDVLDTETSGDRLPNIFKESLFDKISININHDVYKLSNRTHRNSNDDDGSDSDDDGSDSDDSGSDSDHHPASNLIINKISLESGMAALCMATEAAIHYGSLWSKDPSVPSSIDSKYSYFELTEVGGTDNIIDTARKYNNAIHGGHLLIMDAAPNPVNIKAPKSIDITKKYTAIIIDSTNITAHQTAIYIKQLNRYLVKNSFGGIGGVILLVESGSKHPTGGALIYGTVRIVGTRASVKTFMAVISARQHATGTNRLVSNEHTLRRQMRMEQLTVSSADLISFILKPA
ncbi:MAG: hypothetical protein MK132_21230 [Lentisphaerales bacterium]|nr:hypothetical protein [Lentisphaerales bacterium]